MENCGNYILILVVKCSTFFRSKWPHSEDREYHSPNLDGLNDSY